MPVGWSGFRLSFSLKGRGAFGPRAYSARRKRLPLAGATPEGAGEGFRPWSWFDGGDKMKITSKDNLASIYIESVPSMLPKGTAVFSIAVSVVDGDSRGMNRYIQIDTPIYERFLHDLRFMSKGGRGFATLVNRQSSAYAENSMPSVKPDPNPHVFQLSVDLKPNGECALNYTLSTPNLSALKGSFLMDPSMVTEMANGFMTVSGQK